MHSTDNGTESSGGDHGHHIGPHHPISSTTPGMASTIRTLANNSHPGSTNSGTTSSTGVTSTGTTPSHNGALISSAGGGDRAGPRECAGCRKQITERFLLRALDLYWHEDCLKCGCCDCRLGEVGSTLYTKTNLILCKRDYLRLFGTTGYCAACNKVIPAFEMVMRAKSNVYHLECFACQQCNHRFCVGDRFYLCDNKILCEYDYEERLVFANMAYNPSSLAHIRRQVNNLQPSAASARDPLSFQLLNESLGPATVPSTTTLVSSCYSEKISSSITSSSVVLGSARLTSAVPLAQLPPHLHHPPYMSSNHNNNLINNNNIRDDGSSGYGSPDSETFDTPPQ